MKELRPYQQEAIQNLRDTLRAGINRIVLQAPCGAGKTTIASQIVDLARAKGNKAAFVVPAISLIDQTVEAFYADGLRDVGVIQANHHMTDWAKPVQVCSIQTIQARKARPDCQVIMFDECHRIYEEQKRWLTDPEWASRPMIGLSATPWTRGLGKYYHTLLKVTSTAELIEMEYLSPFRVFATGHPNLDGVKTVAGDYHEGQLSERMNDSELTADIIKTYRQLWGKGKTLAFAVDKAHAKSIQERFEHAGISCGYQDADTTPIERAENKRKFHSGEYQVVVNIETLTTGVDWDVRCLILARPTKSKMLFVQIIGRALRTAEGKEDALILDHSDTTARLGFVTEIDQDQLDDGQPKEKTAADGEKEAPLPKPCSECAYLKPPKMRKCPNCGHEAKIECSIMERDGALIQIVPGQLRKKAGKNPVWTGAEKAVFFRELKGYAQLRDYKPGWAAAKYRAKFGEWPPRYMEHLEPSDVLSPSTALWIRSQNIAWAHSKRNPDAHPGG